MELPVSPPVKPMLAKAVPEVPAGMHYEAKWDGFRAIVFRDRGEVHIGSRGGRPLNRYFPELVAGLPRRLPERCVVDGEIVVVGDDRLDFDALQDRVHPAASRVHMLAERTPASFIAFDLLAMGNDDLTGRPFVARRERLSAELATTAPPVYLAPATTDHELAIDWFDRFEGAGLDGVVAKPFDIPYAPDRRLMFKVKHERTADCVVAGFRWHASGPVVGSLLLGLYDSRGALQHVGVAASFSASRRAELVGELEPYQLVEYARHPWADWQDAQAHERGRMPGAINRWSAGKDASWVPLRPELVCEVAYEHMQADRFRHTARFKRWRPDRAPDECTYTQLEEPAGYDLARVLGP